MSTPQEAARQAAAQAPTPDIVSQVQVFGLASAAAVAERYIGAVERYLALRHPAAESLHRGGGEGPAAHALARVEQALLRVLDALPSGPAGWPDPSARSAGPEETLELPAVAAAATCQASVWVHNPTSAPVPVVVRVTSFVSGDGHVLPADAVVVEPDPAPPVGAQGSGELSIRVAVPRDTPVGHYHALLTSSAAPRQALRVHLEVLGAPEHP